ncbi:pre-mRNA splicing factor prp17 [Culex quinquefasciatus]|uniref:Pre-mRNA splicing factor prp17 n=1 Tax=Culex quinquefasciatus TaxID=7176 RepID=B0X6U2_CULQU|nr:pre-mRNA splicing factor prp17 [Culex quinquefasciatus]|eukprot:XP_001865364.1 pre-mRNA splicing factor prp17 [Culex quinquefasciatus]
MMAKKLRQIICWGTRSGDFVQEYERHLGAYRRALILEFLLFLADTNSFAGASNGGPLLNLDHREDSINSNGLPAPVPMLAEFFKDGQLQSEHSRARPHRRDSSAQSTTTILKLNMATKKMLKSIRDLVYKRDSFKHRHCCIISQKRSSAERTQPAGQHSEKDQRLKCSYGRVLFQEAQVGSTTSVGRNCDGLRNNWSLCRLQSTLSSELGNASLCIVIVFHGQSQSCRPMFDHFALIFTSQLKDNNGHFQVATTVLLCSFRLLATSSAAFRFPAYTSRPFLANPFCKLPH